jgi:hypothetical protein
VADAHRSLDGSEMFMRVCDLFFGGGVLNK